MLGESTILEMLGDCWQEKTAQEVFPSGFCVGHVTLRGMVGVVLMIDNQSVINDVGGMLGIIEGSWFF